MPMNPKNPAVRSAFPHSPAARLAALLILFSCCFFPPALGLPASAAPESLNVALYPYVPDSGDFYERARWFSQGLGRAYISYTESMSAMAGGTDGLELRQFSYTGMSDVPLMAADVAAIYAGIPENKLAYAFDLLNLLTGTAVMTAAVSPDEEHPLPQYLLPTRLSAYDLLCARYPVYEQLRTIAVNPENRLPSLPVHAQYIRETAERLPALVFD